MATEVKLVVLCHGMWGNVHHFDSVVAEMERCGAVLLENGGVCHRVTPETRVIAYRTKTNAGYFTYDGIDVCGLRVADEIEDEIQFLKSEGLQVTEFSLVGYSMGGLIARYAAGVLYSRGLFERVKPVSYASICSPHVGVRVLGNSWLSRVFNFIGAWSMARTSQQAFLKDSYNNTGRPLFMLMTGKDAPSTKALAAFERRALYANVVNDHRCEYYTSAIEGVSPFQNHQWQVDGPYVPGYEPVVLQSVHPRFNNRLRQEPAPSIPLGVARAASGILRVCIVAPIWFIAFLINAGYQAFCSWLRTAPILKTSKFPVYDIQDIQGLLEDSAHKAVNEIYHAFPKTELRLTPVQRTIIERLNQFEWSKYPVHISECTYTHAAVIDRQDKPHTHEGGLAVKHLVQEVLELR